MVKKVKDKDRGFVFLKFVEDYLDEKEDEYWLVEYF